MSVHAASGIELPPGPRLPRLLQTAGFIFAGPRFLMRVAELEMHPLDSLRENTGADRTEAAQSDHGLGFCNITKCCTDVCPEHIHITDNAIIPLKERVVTEFHDPVVWAWRKLTGSRGKDAASDPQL